MRKLVFLAALTTLISCGDCLEGVGTPNTEKRTVESFVTLELKGSMDVTIRQAKLGEVNKIEVTAQENLIPHIITKIDGARLVIDTDQCIRSTEKIEVAVICTDLERVINRSSGSIEGLNTFNVEDFEVVNDGSGDIVLKLHAEDVEVENQGSGDVSLSGNADRLILINDGSGDCKAFDLKSFDADVTNGGSGNVDVYAKEALEAVLDGSGNIRYKGKPQQIETNSNGTGQIVNAD
jgi:hypothetical protein